MFKLWLCMYTKICKIKFTQHKVKYSLAVNENKRPKGVLLQCENVSFVVVLSSINIKSRPTTTLS